MQSQGLLFCFLDRAFFNDEEKNQQNALINSLINLLMSDHSDMFRLPSSILECYKASVAIWSIIKPDRCIGL
jgi:hypothetical protein